MCGNGNSPASMARSISSPLLPATMSGLARPALPPPAIIRLRTASSCSFHWVRVASGDITNPPPACIPVALDLIACTIIVATIKPASNPMSAQTVAKPQGCTNFKLRQLMRRVAQHYDIEMSKTGLKTTQYSLLSYVMKLGPVRPGELAQVMLLDASTLTRNLKPLIDAGWIEIATGSDSRSRSVTITEAGREKRQEAQRCWKLAQNNLNQLLGPERVLALHALIDDSLALLSPMDTGADDE